MRTKKQAQQIAQLISDKMNYTSNEETAVRVVIEDNAVSGYSFKIYPDKAKTAAPSTTLSPSQTLLVVLALAAT